MAIFNGELTIINKEVIMTGPFLKGFYAKAMIESGNARNILAESSPGSLTPEQITELNEVIEQGRRAKRVCIERGIPECIPKNYRDN